MKGQYTAVLLLVSLTTVCPLPAAAEPLSEADARAITEVVNRRAERAVAQGDLDLFLTSYTNTAMVLAPGEPLLDTPEAIRAFWSTMFDQGFSNLQLQTLALDIADGLIVEVGRLTFTVESEAGEAVPNRGKFVVVWKPKADGRWGWAIDCFNPSPNPP